MRTTFTLLLIALFMVNISAQKGKDVTIKEFTAGVVNFEEGELNQHSPIASFNKVAYAQATKSVVITKENMASSVAEMTNYKTCFITVGTHTIVKVSDLNKKVMSGSWGCRIPFGEGYIQKGELLFKQDYLNNIIGIPDSQRRMLFMFK
ncbi:hypothetical protein [Labilibacter marinus]|uniref:hypothetical protein n=1 Tax=Labilibacter marinus TaxID=1477105 RepID=UPI00094F808D|nr:hypothetical protein [Labilibacter marinus]